METDYEDGVRSEPWRRELHTYIRDKHQYWYCTVCCINDGSTSSEPFSVGPCLGVRWYSNYYDNDFAPANFFTTDQLALKGLKPRENEIPVGVFGDFFSETTLWYYTEEQCELSGQTDEPLAALEREQREKRICEVCGRVGQHEFPIRTVLKTKECKRICWEHSQERKDRSDESWW